jgi:hypothetical protein
MLVEFASHVDRDTLEELSKKFHRSKASVPTRWVGAADCVAVLQTAGAACIM